jgi:hypothetical protein
MKKIYKVFIAAFSLLVAGSCSNFEELNTNPDVPTSVTPELLLTQLQKDSYRFWNPNSTDWRTAQLWAKHCVGLETNPNPYQYYYSYYPYGSLGSFQKLTNLKRMVEFSKGTPYEASFEGMALFMKASYGFGMTLDMGDIPYTEAGKAEEGIFQPKYDKQADVIAGILKDFQASEEKFAAGKNFGGDFMYNGDVTKWRKYANAMQLKVLQTISKKITAEQKTRFAAIVAAGNLMTSNADIFQLVYSDNPNATHPFYNGENNRIITAVSDIVVDALRNYNDRRLFYFAEPAKYLITGGKLENDFTAYEGAPTALSADKLAVNNAAGKYSLVNKRYIVPRAGDPMLIFTYSEQCFIIAEAIEEGWVTGVAKDYYENGVKAALKYYKDLPAVTAIPANLHGMAIDQAYIDGYFTGEAAYKTGGTKTDRLQQIWMQRYLLDFFQGSGAAYRNFLRTGYPVFPLDPATSMNPDDKNVYPKRWKYPTDELTTNPVNYQKAVDEQYEGYDGINKVPWWLK